MDWNVCVLYFNFVLMGIFEIRSLLLMIAVKIWVFCKVRNHDANSGNYVFQMVTKHSLVNVESEGMLTTSVADKIATRLWDLCGSLITKQPSTPSGVSWWSFSILSTNHLCLWKQVQVNSSCHVVYKPFLKKFSVPTENLEITESLCHHLGTSRTAMIYVITLPWWKISVQRVWELFSWTMCWEISTRFLGRNQRTT